MPLPSDQKAVTFFELTSVQNPQLPVTLHGNIVGDSIYVTVSQSVSLANVIPSIEYLGASISPNATKAQNFNVPVTYTITADDSTKVSYVVVPHFLSSSKSITSFGFESADNSGLSTNLTGIISADTLGVDTIYVYADSVTSLVGLTPSITYTADSISPGAGAPHDFSSPVTYTLTAQDHTKRTYVVIVTLDRLLYVGSSDGNLYALNAVTGQEIWKFTTGGPVASSPTIDNGILYFLSGDSYLYAINATDGSLKWKYQATENASPGSFASNPTVNSGIVYFTAYDNLWAVNASSGSLVWTSYNDDYSPDVSPTVVNGMVLDPAIDGGGTIHSFNAQTGAALTPYGGGMGHGNPAVFNGVVYGADEGAVVAAWDLNTYAGKFYVGYGVGTSPTVYDGVVYNGGTAGLIAVDTGTGALLWQETTFQTCSPAAGGGSVFVCTNGSTLNAYNASTGTLQWSIALDVYTSFNITVSNGNVYVGTGAGVVAVAGSTGKLLWNFQTNATSVSGPLVIDWAGTVHHTTASGDQQ